MGTPRCQDPEIGGKSLGSWASKVPNHAKSGWQRDIELGLSGNGASVGFLQVHFQPKCLNRYTQTIQIGDGEFHIQKFQKYGTHSGHENFSSDLLPATGLRRQDDMVVLPDTEWRSGVDCTCYVWLRRSGRTGSHL